eukprot:233211_1
MSHRWAMFKVQQVLEGEVFKNPFKSPILKDIMLANFMRDKEHDPKSDCGSWKVADDQEVGGKSHCSFDWVRASPGEIPILDQSEKGVDMGQGFARFSGVVTNSSRRSGSTAKIGFCGCRGPRWSPGAPVRDYEGIAMKVRTDGRPYTLQIKARTFFSDFQGGFYTASLSPLPKNEWVFMSVPFDGLILKTGTRHHYTQFELDQPELQSIGLSLQLEDSSEIPSVKEVPFQLDIQYVIARQKIIGSRAHATRVASGEASDIIS